MKKWEFWAAASTVCAAILAAVGLLTQIAIPFAESQAEERREAIEAQRLYMSALQELRWNDAWLRSASKAIKSDRPLPPGRMRTEQLVALLQRQHDEIISRAYGEEKYIYQEALKLDALAARINAVSDARGLKKYQVESDYTIDDVTFLNGFIIWYLSEVAEKRMGGRQRYSLGLVYDGQNNFIRPDTGPVNMRHFFVDGAPMDEYGDYLGLID